MMILKSIFGFILALLTFEHATSTSSSFLIFSNFVITRDEAQYCCSKYGMTLMTVKDQTTQTWLENNLLPVVGTTGAYWLGVFSDNKTSEVYDVKTEPISWTNWDEGSLPPENTGPNGTFMFNSSVCVKGDLSDDFKWKLASCEEKLPYICQTFVNDSMNIVDVGDHSHITCPALLKYKSTSISRVGNILQDGVAYAGTQGLFEKEDKIKEMSSQLDAHFVTNYHDCIILCMNHAQCSEVILVSNQLCMLYQSS
ncbi:uncharacterized protein LOC127717997 [Mytilus californianus]|uniref:uncharacterized protein LOC127717997 n=1 Tax=Mytilus californianus TaxID=6549 RepID=UPI0022456D75|nr:uncharacterized protein LOC127717997 [Mytilus californianus]